MSSLTSPVWIPVLPPRRAFAHHRSARLSVLKASQEPQVEDLQLVVQLHAYDTVVSVDAQQDPRRLAVLSQDHLHLDVGTISSTPAALRNFSGWPFRFQRIRVKIKSASNWQWAEWTELLFLKAWKLNWTDVLGSITWRVRLPSLQIESHKKQAQTGRTSRYFCFAILHLTEILK